MDDEKVKKALDDFEDDDYVASKETLSKEIQITRDKYLQGKLGLKQEINPEPVEPEEEEEEDEVEDEDDKKVGKKVKKGLKK